KRFGKEGGILAHHAYQSFKPDEVTPDLAHKIGVETAKKMWGDDFEVIVATHMGSHCIHNHTCQGLNV
ncbi:MAG: relaxase/mobilization nuclease domain-containing protein, partial [Clostridia bacterium]|nr:relaxase/mobilization nuclease domain-containing protein [Clostridia bacterium]